MEGQHVPRVGLQQHPGDAGDHDLRTKRHPGCHGNHQGGVAHMSEVRCWEYTVPKWEFVCVTMFLSHCFKTFCRFRKRNSVVGSLSSLISKQSNLQEGKWTSVLPATCDWQASWRFCLRMMTIWELLCCVVLACL